MHIETNGKVRRSAEEWREIFARFEHSGISREAFCRREKLSVSTFSNWQRKLTVEQPAGRFVELQRVEERSRGFDVELELPGGAVLRLRS